MISDFLKDKLKTNWGEKADALDCLAYVRVFDPLSPWQCYVYALNPDDEDEVECIVKVSKSQEATLERWFMTSIMSLFNTDGESVEVDEEYRPRRALDILNRLNKGIT